MASPPLSPTFGQQPRPMSAMIRPPRSASRMSTGSRPGGSRASDEESGKTSVKVAVRVRPPLRPEDPGYELIPQRFQRSMVNVTSPTSLSVDSPQGRKIFVFDQVFSQEVQQDGIWDYLSDSINAFVQGYNVSLLAYGQSGAGKSYTMGTSGPVDQSNPKVIGVIPRAAAALFEELNKDSPSSNQRPQSGLRMPARYSQPIGAMAKKEKNWTLKATYVEIYNEHLRDLLVPTQEDRGAVTIREDPKGRILLTGLHQVEINNFEDLMNCLNFGSSIRQTDATAVNAKSSRSHAVFSLNLVQKKPKSTSKDEKRLSMPLDMMTGDAGFMTVDSKFHFVDLAGSERLKNTGAQGERAREGISINAGLAALGKVISQLSSRNAGSHVSYRDSKLTRLLQDSLGGNAITYMVACVTPAEFHLSETLNTIQYAQRARAIQSKPRIQQINDEGDLRALVDRLKAEIAFLREQVRSANSGESSERGRKAPQERGERSNEKEIELQNQLLDLQENYTALSQRHAKLISNITKAQDPEAPENPTADYSDNAVERLKRSNSFAEAVEQVVLEYEKTIQSLESSLSTTRTSLSNVESSLMEKETKLAYVETMNHQLQNRLQKMIERESNTETYLQDLEQKLDGHTSGEEKNAAIIAELRKEIARVRANETNAEDYISTLEERLAEADQDLELMQREIDRLENVVDRQRSLGKLDNLLHELGSLDKKAEVREDAGEHDGEETAVATANGDHDDAASQNGVENGVEAQPTNGATPKRVRGNSNGINVEKSLEANTRTDYPPPSPAQAEFMNDKYEVLQQELFDLKVEHEATINEFDQLSASYEAALREMESMRDQLDEARHAKLGLTPQTSSPPASPMPRPTSFLADARVSELKGIEGQPSSSRSLSSELSLVGESPTYLEPNGLEIQLPGTNGVVSNGDNIDEVLVTEFAKLKEEQEEKEAKIRELEEERERLQFEHQQTLELVAELQTEKEKARNSGIITPQNPRFSLRRKSSQNLIVLDRAQRSFEGLRKLVLPLLEGEPDMIETFDNNLESAMHELQTRSERIAELEKDVDILKIEIEKKNSMIAGLTREREISTKASSPVDITVVAALDQRIEESRAQYEFLKQKLVEQENELTLEIDALRAKLEASINEAQQAVKELLETKNQLSEQTLKNEEQSKRIAALEEDLTSAESRHKEAIESLKNSEKTLLQTIESLQASLTTGTSAQEVALKEATEKHAVAEQERESQQKLISELQATIASEQSNVTVHLAKIAELEQQITSARGESAKLEEQIASAREESAKNRASGLEQADDALKQINTHQAHISEMEKDLAEARSASETQKTELDTLRNSYEDALEQLKQITQKEADALAAVKVAEEKAAAELAEATQQFEEKLSKATAELEESRATVKAQVERLEKLESSLQETSVLIEKLEEAKSTAEAQATAQFDRAAELEKDLAERQATISQLQETLKELQDLYDAGQQDIERLTKKEQKTSALFEELEQQLAYTYDQNQDTGKKLADVTAELEQVRQERQVLIEESESKAADARRVQESLNEEVTSLKTKLSEVQMELNGLVNRAQRSNSTSSNNNANTLRKTSSTTSLPSPPPAIPLPPLPNTLPALPGATSPTSTTPGGNASRRPSKDYVVAHMEDQEARIKTLEKQLIAEKALTQTLEEALTECERSMNRLTSDRDSLQQQAAKVQAELDRTRNESQSSRYSMQAVEDERLARIKAEQAKEQLEQRMQALAKKQKRSFACF